MTAWGKDRIPTLEKLTGETCDITVWLNFGFHNRAWHENKKDKGF